METITIVAVIISGVVLVARTFSSGIYCKSGIYTRRIRDFDSVLETTERLGQEEDALRAAQDAATERKLLLKNMRPLIRTAWTTENITSRDEEAIRERTDTYAARLHSLTNQHTEGMELAVEFTEPEKSKVYKIGNTRAQRIFWFLQCP